MTVHAKTDDDDAAASHEFAVPHESAACPTRGCAISRGERGVRVIIGLVVLMFAIEIFTTQPVAGMGAGVIAVVLAIVTVTGWYPGTGGAQRPWRR